MILLVVSGLFSLLGPSASRWLRKRFHWMFIFGDPGIYLATNVKSTLIEKKELHPHRMRELLTRNRNLRWENRVLRRQNRLLKKYRDADRVLGLLYGPDEDPPVRLLPATVVAADTMPYGWTRMVNSGTQSGAAEGMYVTEVRLLTDRTKRMPGQPAALHGTVLAGRIVESGALTARVRLVTDRDFSLRVRVLRRIDPGNPRRIRIGEREVPLTPDMAATGPLPGLARGDGRYGMIIPAVPKSHEIRPDDVVQTCPDDGSIGAAVTIGTIKKVADSRDDPRHVDLLVDPAVDPQALRELWIVIPRLAHLDGEGAD